MRRLSKNSLIQADTRRAYRSARGSGVPGDRDVGRSARESAPGKKRTERTARGVRGGAGGRVQPRRAAASASATDAARVTALTAAHTAVSAVSSRSPKRAGTWGLLVRPRSGKRVTSRGASARWRELSRCCRPHSSRHPYPPWRREGTGRRRMTCRVSGRAGGVTADGR